MSDILFTLQYGVGNCVQSIPAYLNLKKKHNVKLVYKPIYKRDSIKRAEFFPDKAEEMSVEDVSALSKKMDYIANVPFGIVSDRGDDFSREPLDLISEHDSEVERGLKMSEWFGCGKDIIRDAVKVENKGWDDRKYLIVHNGALDQNWRMKKYVLFPRLVEHIKSEFGIEVASIGAKDEYVKGTVDLTGREMMESAWHIKNSLFYVGTDSGMYHVAGYLEVPGIALFTATSVSKNWDERFHHTITPIKSKGCRYGQWGYHWHPHCSKCRSGMIYHPCQTIDPWEVIAEMKEKLVD